MDKGLLGETLTGLISILEATSVEDFCEINEIPKHDIENIYIWLRMKECLKYLEDYKDLFEPIMKAKGFYRNMYYRSQRRKISFHEYVLQFTNECSPRGTFANTWEADEIKYDLDCVYCLEQLESYLAAKNSPETTEEAKKLWNLFERVR